MQRSLIGPDGRVTGVMERTYENARVIVMNIPFRYDNNDLARLCAQYGFVTDAEVVRNERGSKGFGFVSFANDAHASAALALLHGQVIQGRQLQVFRAFKRTHNPEPQQPAMSDLSAMAYFLQQQQRMAAILDIQGQLLALAMAQTMPPPYTAPPSYPLGILPWLNLQSASPPSLLDFMQPPPPPAPQSISPSASPSSGVSSPK